MGRRPVAAGGVCHRGGAQRGWMGWRGGVAGGWAGIDWWWGGWWRRCQGQERGGGTFAGEVRNSSVGEIDDRLLGMTV